MRSIRKQGLYNKNITTALIITSYFIALTFLIYWIYA